MAITLQEHDNDFVVRDGIVIDKNYMDPVSDEKKVAIGAHHPKLTFYYHLLPIHKTVQNHNVTPATRDSIINSPTYREDVIANINSIVLYRRSGSSSTLYFL